MSPYLFYILAVGYQLLGHCHYLAFKCAPPPKGWSERGDHAMRLLFSFLWPLFWALMPLAALHYVLFGEDN